MKQNVIWDDNKIQSDVSFINLPCTIVPVTLIYQINFTQYIFFTVQHIEWPFHLCGFDFANVRS